MANQIIHPTATDKARFEYLAEMRFRGAVGIEVEGTGKYFIGGINPEVRSVNRALGLYSLHYKGVMVGRILDCKVQWIGEIIKGE